MRLKGLIMDSSERTVTVLTKNNEFYTLKRKPTMYKTQEIEFKKSDIINIVYYIKRMSMVAACLIFILAGMMFNNIIPTWNANNSDVYGYISLDVNPSIEFEIDERQKILGISFLEGLPDGIGENLGLKGMEISEGLFKVINYYNQIGILNDIEENYVLLAGAINDKNKIVRKGIDAAEKNIMESLEDYKNKVKLKFEKTNVVVVQSNAEHMELSKESYISMGKYAIFTEINQVKDEILLEEFKNMSLKDIIEEYMKLSKKHLDSEEEVKEPESTAVTPQNTVTPNPTIEPTQEVALGATPTLKVTPAIAENIIPTDNPETTPTVKPSNISEPYETQRPVLTPTPSPIIDSTIKPSNTPVLHETQRPILTPTPTPMQRPTPVITPTAKPSNTPVPHETQMPVLTPIPSAIPTTTPEAGPLEEIGTGLKGTYYDSIDFTNLVGTRIDPEINFNWGTNSPHPNLGDNGVVSIRWEGQLKPKSTEMYTFYINKGYGVRLWINDIIVINEWSRDFWGLSSLGYIFLVEDQKYDIKLEYHEMSGYRDIQLEWSTMMIPKEVIPQSSLFPSGEEPLSFFKTLPGGRYEDNINENYPKEPVIFKN